jgi:phosphatidylserine/phosphatidylglycerophosphate/cardiolipin synthase-like enzyme
MGRSAGILVALVLAVGFIAGVYMGSTIFARTVTVTEAGYMTATRAAATTMPMTREVTGPPATTIEVVTRTATIPATIMGTVTVTATLRDVEYVCFSRADNCSAIIIKLIDSAQRYVHVAVYSFTLDCIRDALIRARDRGVEVKVVMERDQADEKGSEYESLLRAGVDVRLDGNPYLMHHKFMVIDGKIVVTGSYNWSYGAEERNDENLVVISSPDIAKLYEAEFNRIWRQAS